MHLTIQNVHVLRAESWDVHTASYKYWMTQLFTGFIIQEEELYTGHLLEAVRMHILQW